MTQGREGVPAHRSEVSPAIWQLAADIHAALMDDIGRPVSDAAGFDGRYAELSAGYAGALFGDLALQLADVHLPEGAPQADRSKAIIGAMRRIITTPRLLEAVTGAPYSPALAAGLLSAGDVLGSIDAQEAADAAAIREKVTKSGYLDRSMLTESGRVIQLEYVTQSPISYGVRRGRNATPVNSVLSIKLAPNVLNWKFQVQEYSSKRFDGRTWQYSNPTQKRMLHPTETFRVVAITAAAHLPPRLTDLIDNDIDIGRVTTGTGLLFKHSFTQNTNVVVGYDNDINNQKLKLPAVLQQAYVGNTHDFPLFQA